jgi:hypothetical protein
VGVAGEADPVTIIGFEGLLQYREKADGCWNGQGHRPNITHDLLPFLERHATLGGADGRQDLSNACEAMHRQIDGVGHRVHDPT